MAMLTKGCLETITQHLAMEYAKDGILMNAAACICAHNHPSSDPTPSLEDRLLTQRLRQGAELLGITLLDHLVLGETAYYSFADEGWPT